MLGISHKGFRVASQSMEIQARTSEEDPQQGSLGETGHAGPTPDIDLTPEKSKLLTFDANL